MIKPFWRNFNPKRSDIQRNSSQIRRIINSVMELRQRVLERARSVSGSAFSFGKKKEDPNSINIWICQGLKKRQIKCPLVQNLQELLKESEFEFENHESIHFMNESTGIVIPGHDELRKYATEGDVIRICSDEELQMLLVKFSHRSSLFEDERESKPSTPVNSALGKLKQMRNSNSTFKIIQKTLEGLNSPRLTNKDDEEETGISVDPIFKTELIEEIFPDQIKCDVCDVSWPDDGISTKMYRFKKQKIVTHQGCTQFAADVLAAYPNIQKREEFIGTLDDSNLNRPGSFHITVKRASNLPSVQLLGTQNPYAKLSLLPWKEPFQTRAVEQGGQNPIWKSTHQNTVQLAHMYNSSITPIPHLEVEIWNSNFISDDMIACALLDMTPLLRYPNVETIRWYSLSARAQQPVTNTTSTQSRPRVQALVPKVMLSIKFVPLEGKMSADNEHKFRVHQLKSVGLTIPMCAACERLIVNVIKNAWGYRCELCGIDVHKACIMKAITKCECKREGSNIDKNDLSYNYVEHLGEKYKQLASPITRALDSDPTAITRRVGELYVRFQGLHLCTKQCNQEQNFHAKNIFEGDTYCRLSFDDVIYETSPVLKSADPMYMEKICFQISHRNASLLIEVIDFNSDSVIGEMNVSLFQLLQQKADLLIKTHPLLNKLKPDINVNDKQLLSIGLRLTENGRFRKYGIKAPKSTSNKKTVGYAILTLDYIEAKDDLLRFRADEEVPLLEREEKECTVDTLKLTFERFNRVVKKFQWLDAEYVTIISWKNIPKSAFCLWLFIHTTISIDLEYIGAYLLYGVLSYMLYQLYQRISGAYLMRWIDHAEYDTTQIENLKFYRPLADLYVAVHEAVLSDKTEKLLLESQAFLNEVATSKMNFYVRMKYLPNDQISSSDPRSGGIVFVPTHCKDVLIGWTHPVEKSRNPCWRKSPVSASSAHSLLVSHIMSKPRKEVAFRNTNVSWQHNYSICDCSECSNHRSSKQTPPGSEKKNLVQQNDGSFGIDHHALYFPIPQACRKNYSGRNDLLPWKLFPGLVQFDLCLSLTGEAKEVPDLIIASGCISLKAVQTKDDWTHEVWIPLSTTPDTSVEPPLISASNPTANDSKNLDSLDRLLVRIELRVPTAPLNERIMCNKLSASAQEHVGALKTQHNVSRAKRQLSEMVCESFVEKEKSTVIGAQLLDAYWKVKDTMRAIQNDIGKKCGTIACVENLLNWTHPWKTAVVFTAIMCGAFVCSFIPSRWIVLLFGLSEFSAVFFEDMPPSNQLRNIVWNFLSSIPTDQDLIEVYEEDREIYLKSKVSQKEQEEAERLRLRFHALWVGTISSKSDNDRNYKSFFVAYRPFRFVLWKSQEEAELGSSFHSYFVFERDDCIVNAMDNDANVFHVFGNSGSINEDEKRSFRFETKEKKEELLKIIQDSCNQK